MIVKHTTPCGYCFRVEHLSTKAPCPTVSTDTSTEEVAYYGSGGDEELSGLLVEQPSNHGGVYYAIRILSHRRTFVDEDHLIDCQHKHHCKRGIVLWLIA